MISLAEVNRIISGLPVKDETERRTLSNILFRVCAEDVLSTIDMPPFDKSAMDGYACSHTDIAMPLQCIGEIAAGSDKIISLTKGQCVRIMTGAPVPIGADMVVMKEDVSIQQDTVIVNNVNSKKNICYQAEDVKKGEVVVPKNTLLHPAHIASIAAAGHSSVKVYSSLSVAIAATGSEIVEPGQAVSSSQIYNSNSYQLLAQLHKMHVHADYLGILKDKEDLIIQALEQALQQHDLCILTGGVSVGEYDLVPAIMQKLGFNILFNAVAMKPGKPVCLAKRGHQYICALSGNPVSSFLQFEFITKPLLLHLCGATSISSERPMLAAIDIKIKPIKRTLFIPVRFEKNAHVVPVDFHGSAHIQALANADGLAIIEPGTEEIKKGEEVYVRFL